MDRKYLNKDVFLLKKGDDFIFYAPLKGRIVAVNIDAVLAINRSDSPDQLQKRFPEIYDMAMALNFFDNNPKYPPDPEMGKPTNLCVFPTSNCNLACIYCYADAGHRQIDLDFVIARAGVDYIIKNAKEKNVKRISVNFHGGGEPLLSSVFYDVVGLVEYAKSKASEEGLGIDVRSITNGYLSPDNAEWVAKNLDSVTLSMDGPEDIQNYQRPTIGGNPSYDVLMRTIEIWKRFGQKFSIRATVTGTFPGRLEETVKFFAAVGCTHASLEPVARVGRGFVNKVAPVDVESFVEEYVRVRALMKDRLPISNSLNRLGMIGSVFCGAAGRYDEGPNFCITPEGFLSACYEICLQEDSRSKDFFYGKWDYDRQEFTIFNDVVNRLLSRKVTNLSGCDKCFAKWNCGGDCLAKCAHNRDSYFDISDHYRCPMIRKALKDELFEIADKSKAASKTS